MNPHDTEPNESEEVTQLEASEHNVEDAFAKMKEELDQVQDRYLRLGAEFENFKKRSEKERHSAIKFANERLAEDLLPVLDHLEQAIASTNASASSDAALKNVVVGVDMVLKQFREVLAKFGLKGFDALGVKFDPNLHEALLEEVSDTIEPGWVVRELQKGYMLNDRLLRPARVAVAKKPD